MSSSIKHRTHKVRFFGNPGATATLPMFSAKGHVDEQGQSRVRPWSIKVGSDHKGSTV
jgi:hypothetical protein